MSVKLTRKVALLWGEFGHVLLHVDDAHVGAVLLGDAEEFHNTLVVLDVAVDQDEKKFTLESFSGFGVGSVDGIVVRGRFGSEKEIVLFQITTEDLWCGFVREFVDKWKLFGLDESNQSF